MSLVKKEAYFNSSTGENTIRTLIWLDDEIAPKAVVQIAHGMAEHIGRYDDFARFLVSNGFVVCGNDHLGHGKSVNTPYDYGYFCEYDGDKRIVDDMHILTHIMKKRYPEIPYFIFGNIFHFYLPFKRFPSDQIRLSEMPTPPFAVVRKECK